MKDSFKPWFIHSNLLLKEVMSFKNSLVRIKVEAGRNLYPDIEKEKCYILLSGEISFSSSISSDNNFPICTLIHQGLFGLSDTIMNKTYHITTLYPSSIGICDIEEIKFHLSKNRHTIPFRRGILGKTIHIPSAPLIGTDPVESVFYIISFIANEECKEKIKAVRISPKEIAKILGMKREIVTLAIAKLEKKGWINIIRGNIIVKR